MRKLFLFFLLLTAMAVTAEGQTTFFASVSWQGSLITKGKGAISDWGWLQDWKEDKTRYIRQEFLLHGYGLGDTIILSSINLDTFSSFGENLFSPSWKVSFGREIDEFRLGASIGSGRFKAAGRGMHLSLFVERAVVIKDDLFVISGGEGDESDNFLSLRLIPQFAVGADWSFRRSLSQTGFESKFSDLYWQRALDYNISFEDMKEFRDGDWEDVAERAPRNVGGTPIFASVGARGEIRGNLTSSIELSLYVGFNHDLLRWIRATKRGQGSLFFGISASYYYEQKDQKNNWDH